MQRTQNYIITAADENYYRSFLQLFYSIEKHELDSDATVVVYDIGMSDEQKKHVISLSKKCRINLVYRHFNFDCYPVFVRLEYKTYSWKPIIIHEISKELDGNILWLDSANIVLRNLNPIWNEITNKGSYVPYSGSGTLREWTVLETLEYLNVPEIWYQIRNRAGNTCGFSTTNRVIPRVLEQWKELALIKECIKPEGANRSNHRDDQSLLTILLERVKKADELELTNDEVDISSKTPNPFISVRNYVPDSIPESLNLITIAYFKVMRALDITINRIKGL